MIDISRRLCKPDFDRDRGLRESDVCYIAFVELAIYWWAWSGRYGEPQEDG